MKYKVTTTATAVWHIYVDADSIKEAEDKVLDGDYDEKYDKIMHYTDAEVDNILAISLEQEERND